MTTFDEWYDDTYGTLGTEKHDPLVARKAFNAARAIDKQRITELEQELVKANKP